MFIPAPWHPSYAFGYARNAAEAAYPNLWEGLLGSWHLSLGVTGATLFDVSGYGHGGTLTNMEPATDWVPTERGYALDFDGADEFVELGIIGLNFATGTVSVWFRADVIGGETYVFSHRTDGGNDRIYIGVTNNNEIFYNLGGGGNKVVISDAVAGTWYQVILTWDNGVSTAYVNGDVRDTDTFTGLGGVDTTECWLGAYKHESNFFNGQIGDVDTWGRVLSFNEIQHLHVDEHAIVRPRLAVPLSSGAPAGNRRRRMIFFGAGT